MMNRRRQMMMAMDSYVADGLVLWLDGINRGGVTGEWRDLAGNLICDLGGEYTEGQNGVYFSAASPAGYGMFSGLTQIGKNAGTIECAITFAANDATGRPLIDMGNDYIGGSLSPASVNTSPEVGPLLRWYCHQGDMEGWRFNTSAKSLKMLAGGNSERGILNGQNGTKVSISGWDAGDGAGRLAYRGIGNGFRGTIHSIRIYDRILSEHEILSNQRVDNRRFGFGLTI